MHRWFAFGDLKREMPFESEIVVVPLPGRVVSRVVAYSRSRAPSPK